MSKLVRQLRKEAEQSGEPVYRKTINGHEVEVILNAYRGRMAMYRVDGWQVTAKKLEERVA